MSPSIINHKRSSFVSLMVSLETLNQQIPDLKFLIILGSPAKLFYGQQNVIEEKYSLPFQNI